MNELAMDVNRGLSVLENGLTESHYNDFIRFLDAKPKTIATYTRALKQFYLFLQNHSIYCGALQDIFAHIYKHLVVSGIPEQGIQNHLSTRI